MDKNLKDLSDSVGNLKKEIDELTLKKINRTSYCRYSEIENKLADLQDNQEVILSLLKLIYNKIV